MRIHAPQDAQSFRKEWEEGTRPAAGRQASTTAPRERWRDLTASRHRDAAGGPGADSTGGRGLRPALRRVTTANGFSYFRTTNFDSPVNLLAACCDRTKYTPRATCRPTLS